MFHYSCTFAFVPVLWKVPRPEEEGKGSSCSGFSKGDEFDNQRLKHMEPTRWKLITQGNTAKDVSASSEDAL